MSKPHGADASSSRDVDETVKYRQRMQGMNAFERHREYMRLLRSSEAKPPSPLPQRHDETSRKSTEPQALTDYEILVENHRFLRDDETDKASDDWKVKMARSYYDKLYREYAIVDLKHYKRGDIGLRWRTKQECVEGKGQFICGSRKCSEKKDLVTVEVPFEYVESSEEKTALVKLRLCEKCSSKLNYQNRKKRKKERKEERKKRKRRKHDSKPDKDKLERKSDSD